MPSVELVNGKWVPVSGVRATDLDAGNVVTTREVKKAPATKPAPKTVASEATKTPKSKTDA